MESGFGDFVARFVLLLEHDNSGVNHRHAHLLPKCPHCRQMTQSTTCWGLRLSMWSSDRFSLKSSDAQLGIRRRRNRLSSAFTTFYHGTKQRNIIPYWNSVSVSQFLLTFSQNSLFFAKCFLLKNKFILFFHFIHWWTLCLWKMQWILTSCDKVRAFLKGKIGLGVSCGVKRYRKVRQVSGY